MARPPRFCSCMRTGALSVLTAHPGPYNAVLWRRGGSADASARIHSTHTLVSAGRVHAACPHMYMCMLLKLNTIIQWCMHLAHAIAHAMAQCHVHLMIY